MQRPSIKKREHSSAGSEHLPYKQRVRGSNPFAPTLKTTSHSSEWLCCFKEFASTSKLGVYSQKQRALMRVCRLYALHSELECCVGLSRYERGLLLGESSLSEYNRVRLTPFRGCSLSACLYRHCPSRLATLPISLKFLKFPKFPIVTTCAI